MVYRNLLMAGVVVCLTSAALGVHDPVMIREGDTYYVLASGPGIPIRRSTDLVHWELIGRVFSENVPAWAKAEIPGADIVWAPDIARYQDRYLLYYSVSTMGSQRSCIGLATNATLDPQSPNYKWVDTGKVLESFPDKMDYNAIDPNFVTDKQGQPHLVWGSFWGGIKLMRLDERTCKPPAGENQIHTLAVRPQERAIEGAFLIHKNDWYYLFVSFDHCCRGVMSDYRTMVGRSRDITGPYLDYSDRPMTEGFATLLLASYGNYRGPGHNGILLDGDKDWFVNHMYDVQTKGQPTLQVRRLIFAEDGWPLVSEPVRPRSKPDGKLSKADFVGVWTHSVNFGADNYIKLRNDGKLNVTTDRSAWEYDGTRLLLKWPRPDGTDRFWLDTCYPSPEGDSYVGRNQKGNLVRGQRQW